MKTDVTTALRETLEAPETSVLAPFIDVDHESETSVDSEMERRLVGLEQQVQSLRGAAAVRDWPPGRSGRIIRWNQPTFLGSRMVHDSEDPVSLFPHESQYRDVPLATFGGPDNMYDSDPGEG